MKTIYKYKFELSRWPYFILMPINSIILTCQQQGHSLQIWAIVDDKEPLTETRAIQAFGTGHSIDDLENKKYISTVQLDELVFHIFECI